MEWIAWSPMGPRHSKSSTAFVSDEMKHEYIIQGFCDPSIPGDVASLIATFCWEKSGQELVKQYAFNDDYSVEYETGDLSRIRDSKQAMLKEISLRKLSKRHRDNVDSQLLQMSKVQHPNILTPMDIFLSHGEKLFMIYECTRVDLCDMLIEHGNMKETNAKILFSQLIAALQYLHSRDVVHGSIKPETLLTNQYQIGPNVQWKLIFLLKEYPEILMEQMKESHGDWMQVLQRTANYCVAPELLRSNQQTEKASDMWSVGVCLYTALIGFPPFWCESSFIHQMTSDNFNRLKLMPSANWGNVSAEARDLITRLLEKDKTQRLTATEAMQHPWLRNKHLNDL